jgi:hypothetical protein
MRVAYIVFLGKKNPRKRRRGTQMGITDIFIPAVPAENCHSERRMRTIRKWQRTMLRIDRRVNSKPRLALVGWHNAGRGDEMYPGRRIPSQLALADK